MRDNMRPSDGATPYHVGFLLVENFTLISLSSALEPLRIANLQSGRSLYRWGLVGGGPTHQVCSDGIPVTLDYTLESAPTFDLVIVVGGIGIEQSLPRPLISWLRKQAQRGVVMGSVCTGAYALAAAGLLDGYQCSAHWDCLTVLTDRFPRIACNNQLYVMSAMFPI